MPFLQSNYRFASGKFGQSPQATRSLPTCSMFSWYDGVQQFQKESWVFGVEMRIMWEKKNVKYWCLGAICANGTILPNQLWNMNL